MGNTPKIRRGVDWKWGVSKICAFLSLSLKLPKPFNFYSYTKANIAFQTFRALAHMKLLGCEKATLK